MNEALQETIREFSPIVIETINQYGFNIDASIVFICMIFLFFIFLFWQANRDPKNPINWHDIFTGTTSKIVEPHRVAFVCGVIVSSWIVVVQAANNTLSGEVIGLYLLFLGGSASYKSYVTRKFADKVKKD